MDEDIVEGEVVGSTGPWRDPRIAFEVEDFKQKMDEMNQVYLFAADMISRGAFQPPPQPESPHGPGKRYIAIRTCGKVLIATGSWLLEKCPTPAEESREERKQDDWAWANQNAYKQPVMLPSPDLYRIWRS